MSKKIAIIASVVLFILLVVLVICERRWPEAGVELLGNLFR